MQRNQKVDKPKKRLKINQIHINKLYISHRMIIDIIQLINSNTPFLQENERKLNDWLVPV